MEDYDYYSSTKKGIIPGILGFLLAYDQFYKFPSFPGENNSIFILGLFGIVTTLIILPSLFLKRIEITAVAVFFSIILVAIARKTISSFSSYLLVYSFGGFSVAFFPVFVASFFWRKTN